MISINILSGLFVQSVSSGSLGMDMVKLIKNVRLIMNKLLKSEEKMRKIKFLCEKA